MIEIIQVRDSEEIQKAHDVLNAIVSGEVPDAFEGMERDTCVAAHPSAIAGRSQGRAGTGRAAGGEAVKGNMPLITEEIIDKAIAAAEEGHINGLTYNQSSWCGTACCVLGFARHIAGLPDKNDGPQDEEFMDSPRIMAIRQLMRSPTPAILGIMRKVSAKGKIDLTRANLRGADLRGANLTDANLTGADLRGADLTGADRWDGIKYVPITAE